MTSISKVLFDIAPVILLGYPCIRPALNRWRHTIWLTRVVCHHVWLVIRVNPWVELVQCRFALKIETKGYYFFNYTILVIIFAVQIIFSRNLALKLKVAAFSSLIIIREQMFVKLELQGAIFHCILHCYAYSQFFHFAGGAITISMVHHVNPIISIKLSCHVPL